MKKDFVNTPHWSIYKWISALAKGGGQKKCFNIAWIRTILINSCALQDNVLLPEGFTEFFHHVGNGKELRSIVNHGLVPGRVSLKTGRQAVFFTVVNPMDNQDGLGKTLCNLSQARIAPNKKYLETLSEYSMLVQVEARSTKRTAILSNKIKRSYSLRHTACRVHWENDMHEDQGSSLSKWKRDFKTACCSWS